MPQGLVSDSPKSCKPLWPTREAKKCSNTFIWILMNNEDEFWRTAKLSKSFFKNHFTTVESRKNLSRKKPRNRKFTKVYPRQKLDISRSLCSISVGGVEWQKIQLTQKCWTIIHAKINPRQIFSDCIRENLSMWNFLKWRFAKTPNWTR